MTDEMCEIGDYAIHGEEPYTFEYYNRNYRRVAGYEHQGRLTDEEKAVRELRASKDYKRHDGSSAEGSGDGIIIGQDPSLGSHSGDIAPTTKDGVKVE